MFHIPVRVKQEEVPLAMDTLGMTMDVLQTIEEGKINDDKVGGLMELLNSFNRDISAVFRQ